MENCAFRWMISIIALWTLHQNKVIYDCELSVLRLTRLIWLTKIYFFLTIRTLRHLSPVLEKGFQSFYRWNCSNNRALQSSERSGETLVLWLKSLGFLVPCANVGGWLASQIFQRISIISWFHVVATYVCKLFRVEEPNVCLLF